MDQNNGGKNNKKMGITVTPENNRPVMKMGEPREVQSLVYTADVVRQRKNHDACDRKPKPTGNVSLDAVNLAAYWIASAISFKTGDVWGDVQTQAVQELDDSGYRPSVAVNMYGEDLLADSPFKERVVQKPQASQDIAIVAPRLINANGGSHKLETLLSKGSESVARVMDQIWPDLTAEDVGKMIGPESQERNVLVSLSDSTLHKFEGSTSAMKIISEHFAKDRYVAINGQNAGGYRKAPDKFETVQGDTLLGITVRLEKHLEHFGKTGRCNATHKDISQDDETAVLKAGEFVSMRLSLIHI